MAFNMSTGGSGWRLAGSLITLGGEIGQHYPTLTCLGTLGDSEHQAEGTASDHNPWIKDPHGVGVVRAIDVGGDQLLLKQLRQHLWSLYAMQDDRLFQAGYVKGCDDNLINDDGLPFGVHVDDGDADHLHISVTRSGDAYVAAIDSTRTWGLGAQLLDAGNTPEEEDDDVAEAAIPFITKVDDPQGNPATFIVSRDGHKVRVGDGPTAENMISLGKLPVGDRLYIYSEGFTWAGLSTYPDGK